MAAMNQDDAQAIVDRIKPIGKAIGAAASAGDSLAKEIIGAYEMVRRCPEHGAMIICEKLLDEWEQR